MFERHPATGVRLSGVRVKNGNRLTATGFPGAGYAVRVTGWFNTQQAYAKAMAYEARNT